MVLQISLYVYKLFNWRHFADETYMLKMFLPQVEDILDQIWVIIFLHLCG